MANISSQLQRLHFTDRRRVLANKGITAPPLLERDSVFGTANRYLLAPAPPTWSNRYCRPLQAEPHSPPGGPGVEMADTSVPDTFDAPRRASSVSESDKYVVVDPFLGHAELQESRDAYEWLRELDSLESGPVDPSPPSPFEPLRPIPASPFIMDEFETSAWQRQPIVGPRSAEDEDFPIMDEFELAAWRRQPLVGPSLAEDEDFPIMDDFEVAAWRRQPLVGPRSAEDQDEDEGYFPLMGEFEIQAWIRQPVVGPREAER